MTTKRKTKAQREAEQKAALYRRVHDIYSGALGKRWDSQNDGDFSTAQILANVVPAIREIFGDQLHEKSHLWNHCALANFDNPELATAALFTQGVRA